jgi:hypothetical protein
LVDSVGRLQCGIDMCLCTRGTNRKTTAIIFVGLTATMCLVTVFILALDM